MDIREIFYSMFPVPVTANPIWFALEWAAYIISALLVLWMVVDMIRTDAAYSEDVLQSSREGEIEDQIS